MTAKELRKCLAKVPDDAIVCTKTDKKGNPKYCVDTNEFYVNGCSYFSDKMLVDVSKSKRDCPYLDKFYLSLAHRLLLKGNEIAKGKRDEKFHKIEIVFSQWDEYLFATKMKRHQWLTLIVDGVREDGGKLGVGKQWKICEVNVCW